MDQELIDLSFLNEKERESIVAVLDRDQIVRRREDNRIRNMRSQNAGNMMQRKLSIFTGAWLNEMRLVGRTRSDGVGIIRRSLRNKTKHNATGLRTRAIKTTCNEAQRPKTRVQERPPQGQSPKKDKRLAPEITQTSQKQRIRSASCITHAKTKPASLQDILAILSNTSPAQRRRNLSTSRPTQRTLNITEREKAIFDALTAKDEDLEQQQPSADSGFFTIEDKISVDSNAVRDMVQKETMTTTGTTQPSKKRTNEDQQRSFYVSFQ